MTIADAPAGAAFSVTRLSLGREIGKRLADMGFTAGAEGLVVRSGFFRGPLQVRIRGYDILIRRGEALGVEIEPLGDWEALPSPHRFQRGSGPDCHRGGRRHGVFGGGWAGRGFGARRGSGRSESRDDGTRDAV